MDVETLMNRLSALVGEGMDTALPVLVGSLVVDTELREVIRQDEALILLRDVTKRTVVSSAEAARREKLMEEGSTPSRGSTARTRSRSSETRSPGT